MQLVRRAGEDQPQIGAARLRAMGLLVEDHAVRHHIVARGDKALHALDLHAAQTAGGDLVDVLKVAERRNVDVGIRAASEDRGRLGHRDVLRSMVSVTFLTICPFLPGKCRSRSGRSAGSGDASACLVRQAALDALEVLALVGLALGGVDAAMGRLVVQPCSWDLHTHVDDMVIAEVFVDVRRRDLARRDGADDGGRP